MVAGAHAVVGSIADPARPVFVGRGEELARLRSLTARLVAGHGSVVLIEGEAGIGKTRLLDELSADAGEVGFELFRARARNSTLGALSAPSPAWPPPRDLTQLADVIIVRPNGLGSGRLGPSTGPLPLRDLITYARRGRRSP